MKCKAHGAAIGNSLPLRRGGAGWGFTTQAMARVVSRCFKTSAVIGFQRPLQQCLHRRMAPLRGALFLAVFRILSRSLRALRLIPFAYFCKGLKQLKRHRRFHSEFYFGCFLGFFPFFNLIHQAPLLHLPHLQ